MAKKLETDAPSFDHDLDFDFNSDITGELDQKASSKKRGVVSNVGRGVMTGVKDTATSPAFIKNTLRKALPHNYGTIADGADTVLTETYRLYDQSVKELKPRLGAISRKVDTLIPEGQKTLKALSKKMMQLTGEDRNTTYDTTESQEDQAVTQALGAIFQQNKQYTQNAERMQVMRDGIDLKRNNQQIGLLGSIARSVSIQSQYTTSVTQAYQKKSLELQLRSYITQKEHAANSLKFNQMFQAQYEAIVKNTAMPEYQKITTSERFMEMGRNKFMDSLYGKGTMLSRGMEALKNSGMEILEGFKMSLDNADMGLDQAISGKEAMDEMNKMLVELGEEPLTKMEILGGIAGSNLVEWVRDNIAEKSRAKLEKNKKFMNALAKVAKVTLNPAGAIAELQNSEYWNGKVNDYDSIQGKGFRFLDAILDHFRQGKPSATFSASRDLNDLNSPTMGFDKKAHLSLTEVIPGYLAAIQREIRISRTGDEKTPLQVYNYKSGEFITEKNMRGVVAKDLISKVARSSARFNIDRTAKAFGQTEALPPAAEFELKVFFSRLARIPNIDYTPENIMETRAFDMLSPVTKAFVQTKLEEIANSPERDVKITGLTKNLVRVQEGFPSLEKDMDAYIKAGYGKQLKDLGLIRKDEDGNYERDEEAFAEFLEKYGVSRRKSPDFASSDINVKESIKKMNPKELLAAVKSRFAGKKPADFMGPQQPTIVERASNSIKNWNPRQAYEGIKKTGLFGWKYKQGEGDGSDEEHYGPMAQDVNRNLGEESAPGGKKIDLININGAAMAAVKHLGQKVENLGFWKSGNPLSLIQKDVSALLAIAKRGQQGGPQGRGRGRRGQAVGPMENMGYTQGDGYTPLLTNMIQSIAQLGSKVSGDVFQAAGNVFSFGKDKVATPVIDYVKDAFTNKDNPVRKGVIDLWGKATKMAGSVMDFGGKVINEKLPAGWAQIRDFAKKGMEEVSKRLNEARDLYLPGGAKPIIRAIKLRSGFYRDGETGEVIFTMDKLLACKADIKDAAGNIILSVEEKAQGLIDSHGEQVKTTAMNILNAGIGMAVAAKDRLISGFNYLREKGAKAFDGLGGKMKAKWNNMDMSGFGAWGGKYLKDGYQVWVDIRSILLGDADKVRERLSMKDTGEGFSGMGGSGEVAEGEDHVNEAQEADTSVRYGGGGLRGTVDNLMNTGRGLRDRLTGKNMSAKEKKALAGKIKHAQNKAKGAYYKTKKRLLGTNFGQQGADYVEKMKNSKATGWVGGKADALKNSALGKRVAGFGAGAKAFAKGLPGRFGAAANFFGSFLGGANGEQQPHEQANDAAVNPEHAKELAEGKEGEVKLNQGAGKVSVKDRVFGDSDGDGDVDGSVSDQKAKQEALKAARTKKGAEADLSVRYKSESGQATSFFSKIMDGVSTIFSLATSGLGGLFKGAASILSKAVPVVGTVAKFAGKTAWQVGKFAVRNGARAVAWTALQAIPVLASGAMAVATTAVSAIAAVALHPVVIGAAALAIGGYGIFKLYKWANRNNASELERIRLRQYGVSNKSNEDQYNHLFYTLEEYLLDGKVDYSGNQASLIERNIKSEDIAEIFGVDKKDPDHANAVAEWYSKRFKPFFLTHVTALYKTNPKVKLKDIESLTTEEKIRYAGAVGYESGPWNIDASPVKGIDALNVDPQQTKEALAIILENLTEKAKKEGKKIGLPLKDVTSKKNETEQSDADYVKKQQRESEERLKMASSGVNYTGKNSVFFKSASIAGEDGARPSFMKKIDKDASVSSVPSSIPMAPGGPVSGSGGMQFLKLAPGVNLQNMHPGMLKLLLGMAEEYGNATGKSITVTSGFRSMAQQAALHSKDPSSAAPPGRSLHEFGLAADIAPEDAATLEKLGLMKKYGFTRPVGGEPWHIEPAGIQRNLDLARTNPTQRDMMVDASFSRGGGGYGSQPGSTKYRRNHELAMSLLDIPGKSAAETINKETEKTEKPITAVSTDNKSVSIFRPRLAAVDAANDSQAKTNVTAISDRASASGKLPDTGLASNPGGEAEKSAKPDGSTAGGGDASSGGIQEQIVKSARRAGGDPNMVLGMAAIESDMDPSARPGVGSAKGLFGFLDDTWADMIARHGKKYSIQPGTPPTDVEASTLMATEYMKSNIRVISSVKPNPTFVDAYIAHLFGPSGAKTFFGAEPTAIAADVLPKAAAKNKSIFYDGARARTVKEVYAEISRRLQTKTAKYGINVNFAGMGSFGPKNNPGMKDGIGSGITGGLPGTADAPPVASSGTPAGTPGTASIKPSSNSGLFVDSRASGFDAPSAPKASGQPMAGPISTVKLEASLDKSNELLDSQLKVLKELLVEAKSDRLPKIIAEAIAAATKASASNDSESVKEKDKRNMGRKEAGVSSSLDLSRKAM